MKWVSDSKNSWHSYWRLFLAIIQVQTSKKLILVGILNKRNSIPNEYTHLSCVAVVLLNSERIVAFFCYLWNPKIFDFECDT